MRRWHTLGAALLVLAALAMATGTLAQERDVADLLPPGNLLRPQIALGAILALEVAHEIEGKALVRQLEALAAWRSRRDRAVGRLRALYEELDLNFNTGENDMDDIAIEELERRISDREATLLAVGQDGRILRQRIRETRLRLAELSAKSADLVALLPDDSETLTGVWDIRLIPTSENGVITLFQTGTVISGEYLLDGGWHGSLEGTVVNGRVYLERIDARKGRFATWSGDLDDAGQEIRGTWQERDLAANRPADGSFIATKRAGNR